MTSEARPTDESANLATHAAGLLLSFAGSAALMTGAARKQSLAVTVACVIYCVTLVALYAASTLSHSFEKPETRRLFRSLD